MQERATYATKPPRKLDRALGPPDAVVQAPMSLPPNGHEADGSSNGLMGATGADEASIHLDLLRADLYRLIDELARAPLEDRESLVLEFEQAWERFKDATARAA
jgi:hypothetical protein